MKTLIIDNYDSFTYNLFQLVSIVNGEDPVVIRNDVEFSKLFDLLAQGDFDNIVISPGPGHPANIKDRGICADVIQYSDIPILGICLGMQIIAYTFGARVERADEQYHGRVSTVLHNERCIFQGLPNPLKVARYHSLCVKLDDSKHLSGIAFTDTGTFMAIKHSTRPIWGVQFHPESIATEFGFNLIKNFANESFKYTGKHVNLSSRSSCSVSSSNLKSNSLTALYNKSKFRKVKFLHMPLLLASHDIFVEIFGKEKVAFWLDSNDKHKDSRFSFMGSPVNPNDYTCYYELNSVKISIIKGQGKEIRSESIFDFIDRALIANKSSYKWDEDLPFDFCGGFVGYFGYELKAELSGVCKHVSPLPDAGFIYVESFIAIDHLNEMIFLVALDQEDCDAILDQMKKRILAIEQSPNPIKINKTTSYQKPLFFIARERDQYISDIEFAQSRIREGESYQVCLTNQLYCDCEVDTLELYLMQRKESPAPFSSYIKFHDFAILSSSPERFLKLDRDRCLEAKPIKGSSKRGRDRDEDENLLSVLMSSEKERAENLMIVDLLRNDLGIVSEPGSVVVEKLIEVETFSTVHHLVSTIRSKVRENFTSIDCIKAAFPGGSMTGTPKIRTMEILDELETCARGIYSGSLGYLSLNGTFDFSIVIRTIIAHKKRLIIGAGSGITLLSSSNEELEEMLLKAQVLMQVIGKQISC